MLWIWGLVAGVSLVAAGGSLLAALGLWRHFNQAVQVPPLKACSGLSLIVPIKGADAHTGEILARLVQSEVPGPVEFLFAMETADDPAYAICQQVIQDHPGKDIRIVLTGCPDGLMGKQHNLQIAARQARYPIIGSMDADVQVEPDTLATLSAHLTVPDTGTAYPLPYYSGAGPIGGTIVTVYSNYYYLLYMGGWASTGTAPFVIGALWLAQHDTLKQAGGFGEFGLTVSDDAIIGRNVKQLGLRNRLAPCTVRMPTENLNLSAGIRHLRKWVGMLRAEGLGAIFASWLMWYPVFWGTVAVLIGASIGGTTVTAGLGVFGVTLVARVCSAVIVNRQVYALKPLQHVPEMLIYEVIAPLVLLLPGLFRRTIEWKGRRYRITRGGRILDVEEI